MSAGERHHDGFNFANSRFPVPSGRDRRRGAVTAAEIAAVFEMVNCSTEATGQPVVRSRVESAMPTLRKLGAHEFPHAAHLMPQKGPAERLIGSVKRRLRGR